jgi:hypothetical protein
MRVINEQSIPNRSQRPVGRVEKSVSTHIVLRSDPFLLQYSPERFRNVRMRGIWRQIEKEKTSFLPDRSQLPYFMISVDGGMVKNDKGVRMDCVVFPRQWLIFPHVPDK